MWLELVAQFDEGFFIDIECVLNKQWSSLLANASQGLNRVN